MAKEKLAPGEWLELLYRASRSSLIEFWVDATDPVTTYVLDDDGLADLRAGAEELESYGGFTRRLKHHGDARVPRGPFYLVIVNETNQIVDVDYDIAF